MKLGPNAPCPCGSGKKVKKCCQMPRGSTYSRADREAIFVALESLMEGQLRDAEEDAYELLWGPFYDRDDELSAEFRHVSDDVQLMWFACDYEIEPGVTALDMLLDARRDLPLGARSFARCIRSSELRLYEITSAVPGLSITLRDVLEGGSVTVAERTASRMVNQFDWVAARVVPGASGKPEMEQGILSIPRLLHRAVHAQLSQMRSEASSSGQLAAFYKSLAPFFHEACIGSIIEPHIPEMHNTDGEPMLSTRVHFAVHDRARLEATLDASPALAREREHWSWSGPNAGGQTVALGRFELRGDALMLETNSKERAKRGTELLEALAGDAVAHRATTHEDLTQRVRERLKQQVGPGSQAFEHLVFGTQPSGAQPRGGVPNEIPPEVAEAVVLDHYARHYRSWVDEPVPALDDLTPRAAAKTPALRGRLVELVHGLESMYQQALRDGAPAYDPSWMWAELGLAEEEAARPPPLAHERLAHFIDGAERAITEAAEDERKRAGFDDRSSVLDDSSVRNHLAIQRLISEHQASGSPAASGLELSPYFVQGLNFALHRRKAFWTDASLVCMLAQTDVDIAGADLRAPFPAFALVFTDRHVLSLGERLLSRLRCALSGLILRVATVYVVERNDGDRRALELCFAFDALGDDLPELVHHRIAFAPETPIQSLFPQDDCSLLLDPPIKTTSPLHGLLQVVVNALLYATSAGVEPELRSAAEPKKKATSRVFSSEDVYFLPGHIDISHVRRLGELSRIGEGREILKRYMVRGHWRRAAKSWNDPRMRWIAPYWKGPDMAAVVERAYRLRGGTGMG